VNVVFTAILLGMLLAALDQTIEPTDRVGVSD
jgi:hypothetical protein